MKEYDIGDLARVTAVFTNTETGNFIDPEVVKLGYQPKGGTLITLTHGVDNAVVRDSEGHYHADLNITVSGTWRYRWYSTGTGQAAEEGSFFVREQKVR